MKRIALPEPRARPPETGNLRIDRFDSARQYVAPPMFFALGRSVVVLLVLVQVLRRPPFLALAQPLFFQPLLLLLQIMLKLPALLLPDTPVAPLYPLLPACLLRTEFHLLPADHAARIGYAINLVFKEARRRPLRGGLRTGMAGQAAGEQTDSDEQRSAGQSVSFRARHTADTPFPQIIQKYIVQTASSRETC